MPSVVLFTNGTRGDIQPVIALARGLQAVGRPVRVIAPPAFRNFVESHGVSCTPVDGNPSDLMDVGGQSALAFDGNPIRSARASLDYIRRVRPIYSQMLDGALAVCHDATAIVIGLPTIWNISIAEALNVPCIGAFLQPLPPTGDFPSPLIPSRYSLGRSYNRLSYYLAGLALWIPWHSVINRWRKETLGLKPFPLSGPVPKPFGNFDLILHAFSESIVPRPREWAWNVITTGYWHFQDEEYNPPGSLSDFLIAGETPFYIGFGSPGLRNPNETVNLLLKAIKTIGIRAVLAPPRGLSLRDSSNDVYFLHDSVPHDWLFPRMGGAVHHGGAGTTAAAFRAGIPSLVIPMAVDQFFWGQRVSALWAGPQMIPQIRLTVEGLIERLRQMKAGDMIESARRLSKALRAEDGVTRAVQEIEKVLRGNGEDRKGSGFTPAWKNRAPQSSVPEGQAHSQSSMVR